MNYERLAEAYYSDSPTTQKKAMDAGRYIDRNGMTHAGMANWIKYFDWWPAELSLFGHRSKSASYKAHAAFNISACNISGRHTLTSICAN